MKFPFTWTGYPLFTSITRKVVRPQTGYEKSKSLPVTSAHALQYGSPAVACFSTTAKYFVWCSIHYVSINFHFLAIFMIISLFSQVKFKINYLAIFMIISLFSAVKFKIKYLAIELST